MIWRVSMNGVYFNEFIGAAVTLQPDVLLKTSILACVNTFLFQIELPANQTPL